MAARAWTEFCFARRSMRTVTRRHGGQAKVEYVIVLILIALAVVVTMRFFGNSVGGRYDCVGKRIGEMQVADDPAAAAAGCDGAVPNAPPPTPAGRFDTPMMGNLPLDHCLQYGTNCGQPAADAFCRSKGYARATDFGEEIVASTRTASGQLCDISFAPTRGPFCGRFTYVNCS